MKPSPLRVAIVYFVLIAAAFALIALKLTIWSSPGIVMIAEGDDIVVDSTYLGRYRLGLERIRIESQDGGDVLADVHDPGGRLPNIFRLRAGENRFAVPGATEVSFDLAPGGTYALTLCGNNGWGRTGCRTKRLELPR